MKTYHLWLVPILLSGPLPAKTLLVDFTTQVNPIFQVGEAGCAAGGCHGTGAPVA